MEKPEDVNLRFQIYIFDENLTLFFVSLVLSYLLTVAQLVFQGRKTLISKGGEPQTGPAVAWSSAKHSTRPRVLSVGDPHRPFKLVLCDPRSVLPLRGRVRTVLHGPVADRRISLLFERRTKFGRVVTRRCSVVSQHRDAVLSDVKRVESNLAKDRTRQVSNE